MGRTDRQVERAIARRHEDGRNHDDAGEERDAEPDSLDEEAEGNPTCPGRGQGCDVKQAEADERAGQAGGHDGDE